MFVFGINLPVAEMLFVMMILFLIGLVIIIIQLGRMKKNIRVLDDTTLEIRRYEEEEELVLKPINVDTSRLKPADRRKVKVNNSNALKLEKKALIALLKGTKPERLKKELMKGGSSERMVNKAINTAIYWINN